MPINELTIGGNRMHKLFKGAAAAAIAIVVAITAIGGAVDAAEPPIPLPAPLDLQVAITPVGYSHCELAHNMGDWVRANFKPEAQIRETREPGWIGVFDGTVSDGQSGLNLPTDGILYEHDGELRVNSYRAHWESYADYWRFYRSQYAPEIPKNVAKWIARIRQGMDKPYRKAGKIGYRGLIVISGGREVRFRWAGEFPYTTAHTIEGVKRALTECDEALHIAYDNHLAEQARQAELDAAIDAAE